MKLENFFPFIKWMKAYNKKDFISDFIAGTILSIILIPKSIAYASIAGLPPVYGLYAALLSPAVGALWGSSSHLSTGPAAVISFLVFASVSPLAGNNTELFLNFAILLAFIVGIIQLVMGIFKTGWLMNFVSHSVIIGFVNASALVIGVTQFKDLLGLKLENSEIFIETIWLIIKNIGHTNIFTLIIGIISVLILYFSKKIHKNFPGGIVAICIFSFIAYYFSLDTLYHVKLVGEIPNNIPFPSFPSNISLEVIINLLPVAFVISIIGFVEALSIAKSIASITKQRFNVNQELIGQGLANIVTGFFKGYPVSGSFSGTAVNYSAGGKTGISNVIASVFIILSLLFLSPYLSYLPKAVLAAIVINAVIGLINFKKMFHLYKANKIDGLVSIITFVSAFCMKLDYAIFLGIILSLVLFLYKTITPRINEISKEDFTSRFKNIEKYNLSVCPQIMIIKPEMSLYFANTEGILNKITNRIKDRKNDLKYLVLDFESTNYCDVSAVELLNIFIEDLKDMDIEIFFVNVNGKIISTFKNTELHYIVDEKRILDGKKEVVEKLFPILNKEVCKNCKNRIFNECKTIK